jgi:hypothetical protein
MRLAQGDINSISLRRLGIRTSGLVATSPILLTTRLPAGPVQLAKPATIEVVSISMMYIQYIEQV